MASRWGLGMRNAKKNGYHAETQEQNVEKEALRTAALRQSHWVPRQRRSRSRGLQSGPNCHERMSRTCATLDPETLVFRPTCHHWTGPVHVV